MPSFKDSQIQQISHSYFCNALPNTENHDFERPSKKARLAISSNVRLKDDVRSNIVSSIYSLLGLQHNATLTGLSQNAV